MNNNERLEDLKWVDTHCHIQLMGNDFKEEDIFNLEYLVENSIDVEIAVCRELTKKFETIYRGTPGQLLNELEGKTLKGEITLVISKINSKSINSEDVSNAIKILLKNDISKKDIAKVVSLLTDRSVNDVYDAVKGL